MGRRLGKTNKQTNKQNAPLMVATRGVAGEESGPKPLPPVLPARETACNWVICPLQLSKSFGRMEAGRQVGQTLILRIPFVLLRPER